MSNSSNPSNSSNSSKSSKSSNSSSSTPKAADTRASVTSVELASLVFDPRPGPPVVPPAVPPDPPTAPPQPPAPPNGRQVDDEIDPLTPLPALQTASLHDYEIDPLTPLPVPQTGSSVDEQNDKLTDDEAYELPPEKVGTLADKRINPFADPRNDFPITSEAQKEAIFAADPGSDLARITNLTKSLNLNSNSTELKRPCAPRCPPIDTTAWCPSDDSTDSLEEEYARPFGHDLVSLRHRHGNRGYLGGVTSGNSQGLQHGFDDAYPIGANLGMLVGRLVGSTLFRARSGQISPEVRDQALSELTITYIYDPQFYNDNLEMTHPLDHPVVRKWANYYATLGLPINH